MIDQKYHGKGAFIMSGPSLYKLDAHKSIHDGVVSEGKEILDLLIKVLGENQKEHAKMAAEALVEHWETRLIAHADSEEETFYDDMAKKQPELQEQITKLKRDHDLFRILSNEIKELIGKKDIDDEIIDRFKAIYVLAQIHNQQEEEVLF